MSCAKKGCYSETAFRAVPVWVDFPWPDWVARLRLAFGRLRGRAVQRRALARLDDRLLADIGVTREDAMREAAKLPWQSATSAAFSPRNDAAFAPLMAAQAGIQE
jgi:uncharacterized protein YjiS (DUF1127 family)